MLISINPNDGLPIYRQIVLQIKHAVASGSLKPGHKIPSQRDLAAQLVISHLTVKKAYDTLESESIIHTLRGRGTFVVPHPAALLRRESADHLRKRIQELADAARLLGMDRKAFIRLLETSWPSDRDPSLLKGVRS